jgi:hypothetical protein
MPFGMRMGMGLGSSPQVGSGGAPPPPAYNSYAQAWWNALPAGLKTDERYLSLYSAFADTVTNAVLAKLDVLYLCANHEPTGLVHSTDSACLINFINPAAHKMTLIGTPSTTKNIGVSGGGTHAFNMNYAPGDGGSHNLLYNNHAFGVWCNNMVEGGTTDMGCSTASGESPQRGINIYHPTTGGKIGGRSASNYTASNVADTAGLITFKRSVASGDVFYVSINDGSHNSTTAAITGLTGQSLYLLGNNTNNTLTSPTKRIISLAYAGAYLEQAEVTNLYNAMNTLLSALPQVT